MAISSASAVCAMPGNGLAQNEGGNATIYAADKDSRGLGARNSGPASSRATHRPEPSGSARRSIRDQLPDGYMPLREVKDMTLLGRWALLDDGMSACMPMQVVFAMQYRSSLGDHEADAWLGMHARACAGDPEAQGAFARVCENGSYGAAADAQRAFFWYYRAGLQGDLEARQNAERLMHQPQLIAPATMAEPVLIYPGQWRITALLSPQLNSASVFDLFADGSASGTLVDNSRGTARAEFAVPDRSEEAAADASASAPPSRLASTTYSGGWAFDGIGQILTLIFATESSERRWRGASWQIELTGCRAGSVFGRDRRMVGYTLEHLPQGAASGSEL